MPKWEDIRDDLFEAVISVQPSLTKEQQDQVVVFMQSRGHNMVWNAIRPFSQFSTKDRFTSKVMSPGSKQHVWTPDAYKDVLIALNNRFCPNAADCRAIIGDLQAKGWTYSDNALFIPGVVSSCLTMSGGRVIQKWTAEVHEAILMELLEYDIPNSNWKAIVERLNKKGFTFTLSALLFISSSSLQNPFFLSLPSTTLLQRERNPYQTSNLHLQSPSKMAPTNWDHEAHLALLQAVMARAPPTQAEWDQILEDVGKKGYVYTSGAAMQHLQKLRRKEGTAAAANGGNDKAAPAKKPTKPPKNPGGKRPRKAAPKEEDDDDFDESPTKKVKKENALSPLAGEEDDPLPPAFSTC
ncbi:hypothetical protein V8F20_000275 [Naviculisporaceae sp. PSN 640]